MRPLPWIFFGCGSALAAFAVALVVGLFLIKLLWAWTVPDLFPGAVAQGLVAGTISWWAAFKLAIFLAFLGAIAGAAHSRKS